jgi:microcin C transport system substrate-binding protein
MKPGSNNVLGIRDPLVDAMIEHVADAKSYDDLVAAGKALDRVLLWNHCVAPQGATAGYGPRAEIGSAIPIRCRIRRGGVPALWWWDAAKAAKTAKRAGPDGGVGQS